METFGPGRCPICGTRDCACGQPHQERIPLKRSVPIHAKDVLKKKQDREELGVQ